MSDVYSYEKNIELFQRAEKVIPSGVYGHLGPKDGQFGDHCYPLFSDHAKGSCFWDVDGNRFIDYMCAYGPNILGYRDEEVDAAARAQAEYGDCLTAPHKIMVEFAELLVDTVASADWAFFAKNGSDVTTGAIMCARAYTGKKKIIYFKGGYHGSGMWAHQEGSSGIIHDEIKNNIWVKWNDFEAVKQVFAMYGDDIAAVISQPYMHGNSMENELPKEGFWQTVRQLCDDYHTILVIDDVRCGFRLDLAGSDHYFGFEADLICFCKALANGYNVSALCGKEYLKQTMTDLEYTGSYWMSAVPFAAGIACIQKMKRIDLPKVLRDKGTKLTEGLQKVASEEGFHLHVSGEPCLFYLQLEEADVHAQWIDECVRRGTYFSNHHNHFIPACLSDAEMEETWAIAREAFKAVK